MKNKIQKVYIYVVALLFCVVASSQTATVSSGGNFSSNGGTISFTVGLVEYTTNASIEGSLAQGVQQAFEIQTLSGINFDKINLSFSVYPNPTLDLLTLNVGNFDYSKTTYQLFDLTGKLLLDKKITANVTTISMQLYPQAIYLLNVIDNKNSIKTFKIIKNL
jgi:hypothetical protein